MTGTICPHGGLRRQCETCDLADRLETAEARIAESEGMRKDANTTIQNLSSALKRTQALEREVTRLQQAESALIAHYADFDFTPTLAQAIEGMHVEREEKKQEELRVQELEREVARLREPIVAFLDKWPDVDQRIIGLFQLQFSRSGMQYDGPNIGAEIDALRAALKQLT